MALRYYFYGEVGFSTTAKRSAAARRIDSRASKAGFAPAIFQALLDGYPDWPTGRGDVTLVNDAGAPVPGMRFCYSTDAAATAAEAFEDVAAAWDVFQDSSSWWGYVAQPV